MSTEVNLADFFSLQDDVTAPIPAKEVSLERAYGLRPYQAEAIRKIEIGWQEEGVTKQLVVAATGVGKCLGKGTPVLLYSGRVVPVEEVVAGDLLMGPDSKPRKVLGTGSGYENMYRVVPVKGDSYVVNESHILSLRMTRSSESTSEIKNYSYSGGRAASGAFVEISVSDYLKSSKTFRHCAKGWRVGVSFDSRPVPLDPYILGLWLGDGETGSPRFWNADPEVSEALYAYAKSVGMVAKTYQPLGKCPRISITSGSNFGSHGLNVLKNALVSIGCFESKHVPDLYMANSEDVRLNLLAGLMDSDGCMGRHMYDFVSMIEKLADDVCFLARSVGLAAYKKVCKKSCQTGAIGRYFRVGISGDICKIPCRIARKKAPARGQIKSVLNVGISVKPIGVGQYFGFELSGDGLFLLGDFTVTHNTPLMAILAKREVERGGRALILAHTDELIDQARDKIQHFAKVAAGKEKADSYASRMERIVVGSVQTMCGTMRLSSWKPNHFTLVMVDEAHRTLAKSYLTILEKFSGGGAKIVGVTATADRGDKKELGDFYQRIAFEYNLRHAVRDGWLIRPVVEMMPLEIDLNGVHTKGHDLDQTEVGARLIPFLGKIAAQVKAKAPNGTFLFFMPSVETARLMSEALNAVGIKADWASGDRPERREVTKLFKSGRLQALCNMALYTEGFDYDKVDTIVNLRPTKIRGLYVQIVGRASRPLNSIVAKLGSAPNAFERLAIIKNSPKPVYKILDFLWLYEKHNLVEPASLVTSNPEVAKAMKGKDGDLMEAEETAERDVLKKLEEEVRKNARKKAYVVDPLSVATESHDVELATYEPETANDALPPTEKQLKILASHGIDTSKIKWRGHASQLFVRVIDRHQRGLATFRQLHFMHALGIDGADMTREEASAAIAAKKAAKA